MAVPRTKDNYKDISEEKKSGYFFEGKEIITGRTRGRPVTYVRNPKFYPQHIKVDAATLYAVYGDTAQVAELAQVPENVIRGWKQEPWWIEIQKQVYQEQNEKLAARISSVLDTAITHLEDRLEKGDQKLNPKTGNIETIKVEASVLAKMFENLAHQRRITRGEPTSISAKIGVDDRLKTLETAFLRFAQAKEITYETENTEEELPATEEVCEGYDEAEAEQEDIFLEPNEVTKDAL